eukprot:7386340-Prymnesium_polylepis.1
MGVVEVGMGEQEGRVVRVEGVRRRAELIVGVVHAGGEDGREHAEVAGEEEHVPVGSLPRAQREGGEACFGIGRCE